jgi:glycosyltransferase involved in cell wall biosynthesis
VRVCYFGTYRENYTRNQILIEGLRRNGVVVTECHVPLWRGIQDRVEAASGGWMRPAFVWRMARSYWRLLAKYRGLGDYDVMVLGYPGQLDVWLARALTWVRRRPLVLDVFMSLYLIAEERGLVEAHPLTGRLLYWLEKLSLRAPDMLVQDTAQYRAWLVETFGLDPSRFRLVPTGADDRVFRPCDRPDEEAGPFRVVYYGTFIPNHGVKYIVEAASLLAEDKEIEFLLIGEGPDLDAAVRLARERGLDNVTFPGWLEKAELLERAARAHVCLGAFGQTPQSVMTVQNKIYEALAMGKPVITGDSPAVRSAMRHREHVYLVERADAAALACGIRELKADPGLRDRLRRCGQELFATHYTVERLGQTMRAHLCELVRSRPGSREKTEMRT